MPAKALRFRYPTRPRGRIYKRRRILFEIRNEGPAGENAAIDHFGDRSFKYGHAAERDGL